MIPTIDERLASVVRALTDVVLPSLPPEAALAQEQIELSIGHLQILRAQLDAAPAYEAEELADAVALGDALAGLRTDREAAERAQAALRSALAQARSAARPEAGRNARIAINAAVDALVVAVGKGGGRVEVYEAILRAEKARVAKDRRWFAPFGFDMAPTEDGNADRSGEI